MIELSNIVVSEGSVTEPVSLVEAKAWLQIDHSDHDALLTTMIKASRIALEKHLNLALVAKTVTLDASNSKDDWDYLLFPYARAVNTVVVNSIDENDTPTLLTSGEDYYLRGTNLRMASGRHSISYAIVPGTITEDLKEAIMMEVAERYRNRGENNVEGKPGLSEGAKLIASPYAQIWL